MSISGAKHIIQKQSIEIDFTDQSNGFTLQNEVAGLFYEKLLPRMEILFDEFGKDNYLISFETLQVDCGALPSKNWEEALVEETLRALRKELLAADKIKISEGSVVQKTEEAFLFFIEHGYLPWNSVVVSIKELEQWTPGKQFAEKLKHLIQAKPAIAYRLVNNFSGEFLLVIIILLADQITGSRPVIINKEEFVQQPKIMQAALIRTLCSQVIDGPRHEMSIHTDAKKDQPSETEGIYIHNAGLVILHPFLPELFKTLDLVQEKDEGWYHTANLVLEDLVTGVDEFPEFNLPLNKILCGMEPDETLRTMEPLSTEIKAECDSILRAVIQHWSALKNTGIEALRETYLQRFGKLTKVDHGWLLQVEPGTVDVLLGRLPWGFGTIQLPWMKNILFTEWY
jgi:hypothetical protein